MSNAVIKAKADGPSVYVAELGCSVPTFTTKSTGRFKPLPHHVPPQMRGPYRPNELANWSDEKSYRTDELGYVLCSEKTKADTDCGRKAQNRSPFCDNHGGSLHSDDKFIKTDQSNVGETEALSRYKQFLKGMITVDDLDDEELACCGFRSKSGRIYRPKNVPRDLTNAFTKAIYERAQTQLRALTVDAVDTIGEIMKNKANEPDIRLKGALAVLERNLGKPQQVIALTADKPFEEVFTDVFTGTREESRQRRQITSERIDYAEEVPLDAERQNSFETDPLSCETDNSVSRSDDGSVQSSEFQDAELDTIDRSTSEVAQDVSMFSRNPAILAQTVEIKPFEYDLSDKTAEIKKATKRRYAARALGFDPDAPNIPFVREESQNKDGTWHVRHINPLNTVVGKQDSKSKIDKRKAYTLSDF